MEYSSKYTFVEGLPEFLLTNMNSIWSAKDSNAPQLTVKLIFTADRSKRESSKAGCCSSPGVPDNDVFNITGDVVEKV